MQLILRLSSLGVLFIVLLAFQALFLSSPAQVERTFFRSNPDSFFPRVPRPELDLEIVILAYNRPVATRRLWNFLSASHYYGYEIPLRVCADGNGTGLDLVRNFTWPHGRLTVMAMARSNGLVKQWIDTLSDSRTRYVAVFEDDMVVHPQWFEWFLSHFEIFVSSSFISSVSLSALRYDELYSKSFVYYKHSCRSILHRVASSWGVVFDRFRIRTFKTFYRARISGSLPQFVLMNSHSSRWRGSWKRFMFEFHELRNLYTLYPAYEDNSGFATTLHLGGVHVKSSADPEDFALDSLYARAPMAPKLLTHDVSTSPKCELFDIPAFGMRHEKLNLRKELAAKSSCSKVRNHRVSVDALVAVGCVNPPSCLLERISDDWRGVSVTKFVSYQPQMGLGNQLAALSNAIDLGRELNRTVVIPNLYFPRVSDPRAIAHDFFDVFQQVPNVSLPWVRDLPAPPPFGVSVERGPRFDHHRMYQPNSFDITSLYFRRPDREMFVSSFLRCNHNVIHFNSLFAPFPQRDDRFVPLTTHFEFSSNVRKVARMFYKPSTSVCIHVRRGDFLAMCNSEVWWLSSLFEKGYQCAMDDEYLTALARTFTEEVLILTNDFGVRSFFSNSYNMYSQCVKQFSGALCAAAEVLACSITPARILNAFSTFSLLIDSFSSSRSKFHGQHVVRDRVSRESTSA